MRMRCKGCSCLHPPRRRIGEPLSASVIADTHVYAWVGTAPTEWQAGKHSYTNSSPSPDTRDRQGHPLYRGGETEKEIARRCDVTVNIV
jgi:hypothetical protein